ncbi:uncharacterized protein EDB91DRAFT_1080015 [Suillus paluster]|uniref:uncharacterized protein n=1 Tax=Suillus paluster TaxID=48578 RepID=UPI001B86C19E|nr:uncharacterized protein EDB91DRAFT_1080015 [Suillus paluster]KAG1746711.1 hypothetical protein EDB91DRAFT_1080015 [Suillus paluster]
MSFVTSVASPAAFTVVARPDSSTPINASKGVDKSTRRMEGPSTQVINGGLYSHFIPEDYALLDIFYVPSLKDLAIKVNKMVAHALWHITDDEDCFEDIGGPNTVKAGFPSTYWPKCFVTS